MLSLMLTMALAGQSSLYTQEFHAGQTVDASQGFYVCRHPPSQGVLDRLVAQRIDDQRHRLAARLGCGFHAQPNHPQRYQVVGVQLTLCLDRQGERRAQWCGREAHQLLVRRAGETLTLLWISMDQQID